MALESLPLQPGNWDHLNDYLTRITTGGSMPAVKYRLVSDGTTVTAYDQTGTSVASGTDGGAVLTACLPAAASAGATIEFRNDGNVFPWSTVPALPKGITRKLLIRGNGSLVQLSTSGPRFLDFNKTADYDTFQNIEITDFVIDANNVGGRHHVVLGTYTSGNILSRINLAQIKISNVKTVNVPVDSTVTNHRLNVYLIVAQAAAGEGTQNTLTDITVEKCRFEGGNHGVSIGGTHSTGTDAGLNVAYDRILIKECYHSLLAVQSSIFSAAHFFVGSGAAGGKVTLRDLYGEYSGDVGVEIDNPTDATIDNVTIKDCFNVPFLSTNFNTPTNAKGQVWRYEKCVSRTTQNGLPNVTAFTLRNNNSIALGKVELVGCRVYRNNTDVNTNDPIGLGVQASAGGSDVVTVDEVLIDDFKFVQEGLAFNQAGNLTTNAIWLQFSNAQTTPTRLKMTDCYVYFGGSRANSGVWTVRAWIATGKYVIDVDRFDFDPAGLTGMSNASVMGSDIGSAASTIKGTVRRYRRLSQGGSANHDFIIRGTANLSISDKFEFEYCDFTGTSGGEILFATVPQNQDKVFTYRNRWNTFPKIPVAMGTATFSSATWTNGVANQYVGGDPATIQFVQGSGSAITGIDKSVDNVTWYNVWTQASGAMSQTVLVEMDNANYLRVAFTTTAPTTNVLTTK